MNIRFLLTILRNSGRVRSCVVLGWVGLCCVVLCCVVLCCVVLCCFVLCCVGFLHQFISTMVLVSVN